MFGYPVLRSKPQRWIPELRFGYPPLRNFPKSFWEKLGIFSKVLGGLSASSWPLLNPTPGPLQHATSENRSCAAVLGKLRCSFGKVALQFWESCAAILESCAAEVARPRDIPAKSRDIPPKKFDFPGFEGHTELFGPHPFTWKTPTPPENVRTQKFGFGFVFLA